MACSISAPTLVAAKGSAFAGRRPMAQRVSKMGASRPAVATAALAEAATGRKSGKQLERMWKKGGASAVEKPEYMELGRLLDTYDFKFKVGDKVTGSIFNVDNRGAYVDIGAKASAFMPMAEAAIVKLESVRLSPSSASHPHHHANCFLPIPWPPPRGRHLAAHGGSDRAQVTLLVVAVAPLHPRLPVKAPTKPHPNGRVIGRSAPRVHGRETDRHAVGAAGSLRAPSPTNCRVGKGLNCGNPARRAAGGSCEGSPEKVIVGSCIQRTV